MRIDKNTFVMVIMNILFEPKKPADRKTPQFWRKDCSRVVYHYKKIILVPLWPLHCKNGDKT